MLPASYDPAGPLSSRYTPSDSAPSDQLLISKVDPSTVGFFGETTGLEARLLLILVSGGRTEKSPWVLGSPALRISGDAVDSSDQHHI